MHLDSFPLLSIIPLIRVTKSDLVLSCSLSVYLNLSAFLGLLCVAGVWVIMGSAGHFQRWYRHDCCSFSSIYLEISHMVYLLSKKLNFQRITTMHPGSGHHLHTCWVQTLANHGSARWFPVSFDVWSDTLPSFWASYIDGENHVVVEKSWEDKYHY